MKAHNKLKRRHARSLPPADVVRMAFGLFLALGVLFVLAYYGFWSAASM